MTIKVSELLKRLDERKAFWLNGATWIMGTEPDNDCAEAATVIRAAIARAEAAEARALSADSLIDALALPIASHTQVDDTNEDEAFEKELADLMQKVDARAALAEARIKALMEDSHTHADKEPK